MRDNANRAIKLRTSQQIRQLSPSHINRKWNTALLGSWKMPSSRNKFELPMSIVDPIFSESFSHRQALQEASWSPSKNERTTSGRVNVFWRVSSCFDFIWWRPWNNFCELFWGALQWVIIDLTRFLHFFHFRGGFFDPLSSMPTFLPTTGPWCSVGRVPSIFGHAHWSFRQ